MFISDDQHGATALGLARGGGSQFLERMLLLATEQMGADGAVLISHRKDASDVLCSVGMPLSANSLIDHRHDNPYIKYAGHMFENMRSEKETLNWPFVNTAPYWQSVRLVGLDIKIPTVAVVAIFGSHLGTAPRTMCEPPPFFARLIHALHDLFYLINEIADLSNRPMLNAQVEEGFSQLILPTDHQREDHHVVERFLVDTLILQPRVLSRGTVSFHSIRRWRRSVKAEQISALKALKGMPSGHFEESIAEEMSSWCRRACGGTAFANVVAVPCGHSGDDCLSRRIGQQIATMLGINYVDAFAPIKVTGSSHPKTNMKRPKLQLKNVPIGPVLLIDDVATSGAHIEEATIALRNHDLAVTSMVWIASG